MRVLVFLAIASLAGAAQAAGPYFVEITGGYSHYDMTTVNDFIDSVNEDAGIDALEHLDGGRGFGVALGKVFTDRISTAVVWEKLRANMESSAPEVELEIHAPAHIFAGQFTYRLTSLGPVDLTAQGAAGIITTSGHVEYRDENDIQTKHEYSGNTILFEGLLGAQIALSKRFDFTVQGGYRQAKIKSTDWEGDSFGGYGTFSGPGMNYSGLMVRAGLRIGLNWTFATD